MSVASLRRQRPRLLTLGTIAVATVVACDSGPTQPRPAQTSSRQIQQVSIEGDTTACRSGWDVVNGRYVCLGT